MRRTPLLTAALVLCLAAATTLGAAASADAQVAFTEVTATALPGIATAPGRVSAPPEHAGGAAVGDCDGDGWPDVYFTGLVHDVLYRNRGDGTFEDVTVAANLGYGQPTNGAGFGDIDNDGDLDLYVTGLVGPRHYLYVNDGNCVFSEEGTERGAGFGSTATGRSVSFADYDRDGYLDLYAAEWQSEDLFPGAGLSGRLFRNRGTVAPGHFTDVTVAAGVSLAAVPGPLDGTFPFTARFTDFDRDGWPDLAIVSDFAESRLFWNDGDGTFTDGTEDAGVGTDEHGMGATTADLDGDGHFDLFVTSIYAAGIPNATGNRLYRNEADRTFSDVTDAAGVRNGDWGWGTEAFDYDNDGDLDLVMVTGTTAIDENAQLVQQDIPELVDLSPYVNDPPRLWRNDGAGTFTEVTATVGLYESGVGRAVAPFDYDRDGDVDVLVLHEFAPPLLFRNDGGNASHWIDVELRGLEAQRQGVGAIVTVTPEGGVPMVRELSASSTYVAQDGSARLHFGLGPGAPKVENVRVEWPSGTVQNHKTALPVDGVLQVTENVADPADAKAQCILALNKAGEKLAKAVGKRLLRCVKAATGGTLPGGQDLDACLADDASGKIARLETKTQTVALAKCIPAPDFGAATAADVNQAVAGVLRAKDVLGPDLDAAIIPKTVDPDGAGCQIAVAKGLVKTALAQMKAFNRCKKHGLKRGLIASAGDLAACYAELDGADAAKIAASAERQIVSACDGVDLAAAFPGRCAAAPDFFGCVRSQARCGVCMTLNGADRLTVPCHQFSDGVATVYCGDQTASTHSIARRWNEALLAAIRRDTPRPTVHARNLLHLSAVMWDTWLAYGGTGSAWLTAESHPSVDPARDREIAISFAAYRLLAHRFVASPNAATTAAALRALMYDLGFDVDFVTETGNTPAAVGNRIGTHMIEVGLTDGANEIGNYGDPSYAPVNEPMVVKLPGTAMVDPNRWQPLALDLIISQNGIPLPGKVQQIVGAGWNYASPFALEGEGGPTLHVDPGPPPQLGVDDAGFKASARLLIEYSRQLDPDDGVLIDISPGARGNNTLGTNDGTGHAVNPVTGQPYAPHVVPRGDFARVLTEYWADGPQSETPPGHWNVVANEVSDVLPEHRVGGVGPDLDRLEWDVKLYFTLNGAVHDAAIVAWGLKRHYDSARPISMIRWLCENGQATDPNDPSYDPDGIDLEPGLIEVITPASTAPGERHEHLAEHLGEIAIRAYGGPPATPTEGPVGAKWIRCLEWIPYQLKTFVTPAFPGYTSGHSTFSRAAAEVMTLFTGDPFVPGGYAEHVHPAGTSLKVESGPSVDVHLQWATYYDAADQAGLSRLYGGIHIEADDFNGRITGSQVGIDAFAAAMQYFAGSP
jgi:hypothetical protein